MGLNPGQTNNYKGRPKGTKNKAGRDLRERISAFLSDNWQAMEEEFNKLEPKDKLIFYEKLMQYGLPKLQSISHDGEINISQTEDVDYQLLTPEQIDKLIEKL
jgi:hypothetical protein